MSKTAPHAGRGVASRSGRHIFLLLSPLLAVLGSLPEPARACDICAVYTAVELGRSRIGFRIGAAEQYTHFSTWKEGTKTVPNPGERLDSSITQIFVGYNFKPWLGVQLNVPVIYRSYHRREEGQLRSGSESGLGDLSLLAQVRAFDAVGERGLMRTTVYGGLKLPSGDPDRLREEREEEHDHEPTRDDLFPPGLGSRSSLGRPLHTGSPSGIHGHDHALGSGSVDGIVGAEIYANYDRFFWTVAAQYAIRTESAFDYQYANDLTWVTGPGFYPYLADDMTFGAQAVLTGETKGNDTFEGAKLDDTAITSLYIGPALRFSWTTRLAAELMADLPVLQNVSALQIVPDYRIRAGLVWRF